ncbi:MAG: methyltransferase domain-containing protein [Opitutaceae bacterium]
MSGIQVSDIISEQVFYPNKDGKKIVAYVDARSGDEDAPFVVIMPKYGESKKNNLPLAYYLAANRFRVIRFDFTSHFGESDGAMLDFTLGEGVENVTATLDFLERTYGCEEVTLLANSLSSLMAVRAAREDRRVRHLVGVVGVVDLTYTLFRVYQEDLVAAHIGGKRFGVLDILGHEVNMDRFFDEAVEGQYHRLDDMARDISLIDAPISWFPASHDSWVRMEDVQAIARCNDQMRLYPIEGAMHEVRENQETAERSLRMVVGVCQAQFCAEGGRAAEVRIPDKRALFAQNRIERDRLKKIQIFNGSETDFWGEYLGKYRVMEKIDEFQHYLDLVGDLIGKIEDEDILLDAGCGNGLFGVWVLRELIQRRVFPSGKRPIYLGIELTAAGLSEAIDKHRTAHQLLTPPGSVSATRIDRIYARGDLEEFGDGRKTWGRILQFADNCFDKIVCSLVLSYLEDPERLLQHFYRVLQPGGRIVVSSMKPFCDLSAIYRDFIEQKASRPELESARELLRAAGAIKVKEEQGYYVFFSSEQLTAMLERAGFNRVQCFTSLGNQANVVAGIK